jgi:hypothetical protein
MSRAPRIQWLGALAGVIGLALWLVGVSFGGAAHQATVAKVTVTLSGSSLGISNTTIEAGPTTFLVVNKGHGSHALAITGPGLRNARTPKLVHGGSAKLTVTLKPGAYMLEDPFGSGYYDTKYIDIVPAAVVSAKGDGSVVNTATTPGAMCSEQYVAP